MRALSEAVAALDGVLAEEATGEERAWASRLDQALREVLRAARHDAAALEAPDEGLLDGSPAPASATLERRVGALHQELSSLALEVAALRAQGRRFLEAAAQGDASPFAALRRRAGALRQGLRHYESAEAGVLLDAVATDIGAGD